MNIDYIKDYALKIELSNGQKRGVNNRFASGNAASSASSASSVRKLNVATTASNQRGLMEKFLASHGKINIAAPAFSPST